MTCWGRSLRGRRRRGLPRRRGGHRWHMHVCHLNSTSVRDIEACAQLVQDAQARGLPVTVEAYPYGAGSTTVGAELFRGDDWIQRFGVKDASALEFNGEPLTQAKIDEMQKGSPGDVVVIHFLRPDDNEEDQALMDQLGALPRRSDRFRRPTTSSSSRQRRPCCPDHPRGRHRRLHDRAAGTDPLGSEGSTSTLGRAWRSCEMTSGEINTFRGRYSGWPRPPAPTSRSDATCDTHQ